MSDAIHFDAVSKRYKLGASARSLRDTFRNLILRRKTEESAELWALRDVSFAVAPGESIGLVGPNGAGKSTLLRLLAGISRPTKGSIAVTGRVSALLELGTGFHPELTGRENIYLYGAILGLRRLEVEAKFDDIVNFSELEQFLDTPVKRYSSGMYVRLAFAVAAQIEPDVLLVDEVLAVGDAAFRQKCMDRMATIRKQGATLFFVSHHAHMVRAVCQRGLFLNNGRVQALGPVEEVIEKYEQFLRNRMVVHISGKGASAHPASGQHGDQVAITAVVCHDAQGQHTNHYKYQETLGIRATYRTATPLLEPVLHVRLYRRDGLACATMRSTFANMRLEGHVLHGVGSFSLWIEPLQLA